MWTGEHQTIKMGMRHLQSVLDQDFCYLKLLMSSTPLTQIPSSSKTRISDKELVLITLVVVLRVTVIGVGSNYDISSPDAEGEEELVRVLIHLYCIMQTRSAGSTHGWCCGCLSYLSLNSKLGVMINQKKGLVQVSTACSSWSLRAQVYHLVIPYLIPSSSQTSQ